MPLPGLVRTSICVAALFTVSALDAQTRYVATDLGGLGRTFASDPIDLVVLNASGQVAYFLFHPESGSFRPTIFREGVPIDLDPRDGETSGRATAINDAGDIAGAGGTASPGTGGAATALLFTPRRPFITTNGVPTDIGVTGNFSTFWALNNRREAVYENVGRAFLFANGTSRDLGTLGVAPSRPRGINDAGQIVGFSTIATGGPRHAFLYENGAMRDLGTLPRGTASQAEGINARGQSVGFGTDAAGANHAFLYESGTMRDLGLPAGSTESRAYAINTPGHIVGFFRTAGGVNGGPRAFIHRDGSMIDLNTLVSLPAPSVAAPGFAALMYATSINDAGQIGGIGSFVGDSDSSLHAFLLTPIPIVQPGNLTAALGSTVQLSVNTSLRNPTSFQWLRNGAALPAGGNERSLLIRNVGAANAGSYMCVVSDGNVRVASNASTLIVTNTSDVGRLTNLSIRAQAGTGAQTLIVGLTVGGAPSAAKPLLIRAVGPGLAGLGVTGALADPQLGFYSGATLLRANDNWDNDAQAATTATQVGAFALAPASKDAALFNSATAVGSYTVQISGTGSSTGVALAEIYDATSAAAFGAGSATLVNLSARTQVGPGSDLLIAGFTVGGFTSKTVLIRAIGPTLSQFDVAGALADPRLELYSGTTKIDENDNWGGSAALRAMFSSLGAFTLDSGSNDAALLVTLPPGGYTAQVSGVNNTTGVALIEVYEVP